MAHDSSYKLLYSHPAMVADLLRGFIPGAWVGELNLTSLEKVSGSYVSDDLRDREDDLIWWVRWGKDWLYVYLLLEFQSRVGALDGGAHPDLCGLAVSRTDPYPLKAGRRCGNARVSKRACRKACNRACNASATLVRKRFGAEVVEPSVVLLQDIDDPDVLEDLYEQVLDCADGEDWLRVLRHVASTRRPATVTNADAGKLG